MLGFSLHPEEQFLIATALTHPLVPMTAAKRVETLGLNMLHHFYPSSASSVSFPDTEEMSEAMPVGSLKQKNLFKIYLGIYITN